MQDEIDYWIQKLKLVPHPEGGYYREVYRSNESIEREALPSRFSKAHVFGTSIYFLLSGKQTSALHRLKSDEIWHFYLGSPAEIILLFADGRIEQKILGRQLEQNQALQVVIPHGCWFGARVAEADSFTLMGCTVAPGFDFADFELADREELVRQFPQHKQIIRELTH